MNDPPPDYPNSVQKDQSDQAHQPYGQMPQHQPSASNLQMYGQQPQPMMMQPSQHMTTVVVNQPASVQNDRILGSKYGHRDWSTGLFSCCDDVGKCMWVWCCPSCALAEISSRLNECSCVTCCIPGGLASVRTRIRTLGGIQGSICKDYFATECCQLCAICQIYRELDYMGL